MVKVIILFNIIITLFLFLSTFSDFSVLQLGLQPPVTVFAVDGPVSSQRAYWQGCLELRLVGSRRSHWGTLAYCLTVLVEQLFLKPPQAVHLAQANEDRLSASALAADQLDLESLCEILALLRLPIEEQLDKEVNFRLQLHAGFSSWWHSRNPETIIFNWDTAACEGKF